jgi:TRAP-type C4-dicarboxylate transport system substrate-binding protein
MQAMTGEALEQLKGKGIEFNEVELDLFREKVRPVYEKNADRVGGMEAIEAVASQ